MQAAEEVLMENPKTRQKGYLWLYLAQVLRKMGYKLYIDIEPSMPSPDSMLTERRTILHKRNKFKEDFVTEEGVSFEPPVNQQ